LGEPLPQVGQAELRHCRPARLRGALEAPPSLVARRRLLAPQSRRRRAPPARSCVVPLASGAPLRHRLPSSLVAGSSLLSPGGAAPLRLAHVSSRSPPGRP